MRKTPFQKMKYLQLPSIKCQPHQNLKVFTEKGKKDLASEGFEPKHPGPKSAMLSITPQPLTY